MSQIPMIEDEPRISSFVAKGLRAEGLATTVAATGREGLVLAVIGGFELVILDRRLPAIDGFEVLMKIRAQDARLPVRS